MRESSFKAFKIIFSPCLSCKQNGVTMRARTVHTPHETYSSWQTADALWSVPPYMRWNKTSSSTTPQGKTLSSLIATCLTINIFLLLCLNHSWYHPLAQELTLVTWKAENQNKGHQKYFCWILLFLNFGFYLFHWWS